jgi:hypothetical protein
MSDNEPENAEAARQRAQVESTNGQGPANTHNWEDETRKAYEAEHARQAAERARNQS